MRHVLVACGRPAGSVSARRSVLGANSPPPECTAKTAPAGRCADRPAGRSRSCYGSVGRPGCSGRRSDCRLLQRQRVRHRLESSHGRATPGSGAVRRGPIESTPVLAATGESWLMLAAGHGSTSSNHPAARGVSTRWRTRGFRRVADAAGLTGKDWTPRELRHSFVSLLSDSGVPVEQISRLVGPQRHHGHRAHLPQADPPCPRRRRDRHGPHLPASAGVVTHLVTQPTRATTNGLEKAPHGASDQAVFAGGRYWD